VVAFGAGAFSLDNRRLSARRPETAGSSTAKA
jgi:hypothetical protein